MGCMYPYASTPLRADDKVKYEEKRFCLLGLHDPFQDPFAESSVIRERLFNFDGVPSALRSAFFSTVLWKTVPFRKSFRL